MVSQLRGWIVRRLVLILVSAILLLPSACSNSTPPRGDLVRPVKTMVVTAGGDTHLRMFPGKAEASKKAELAFQVSGLITQLPVREGQKIAKGETIAQLRQADFEARLKFVQGQLDRARADLTALRTGERPEQQTRLEAQVRAAEAQLAFAKAEFDRSTRLVKTGAVAREEFDRNQAAYRVAQEECEAARQSLEKGTIGRVEDIEAQEAHVRSLEGRVVEASLQLADSTLVAPYDGVIAQRFVEQNQNVQAKQPIVKFQDVDEIDVLVDVPETVMANLRLSDIVEIQAEFSGAPGLHFPAHIKEIAQRADPTTQTFQVRIALKSPPDVNLLPGMSATVTVTYRRAGVLGRGILVPIAALFQDSAGKQVVWVLGSDQSVTGRPVRIGTATGGSIEVLDGLRPGDRIAVAGVTQLRDGMKVRDLGDALGSGTP
jgi:membrane fusion protein, multidrug efflux system